MVLFGTAKKKFEWTRKRNHQKRACGESLNGPFSPVSGNNQNGGVGGNVYETGAQRLLKNKEAINI